MFCCQGFVGINEGFHEAPVNGKGSPIGGTGVTIEYLPGGNTKESLEDEKKL